MKARVAVLMAALGRMVHASGKSWLVVACPRPSQHRSLTLSARALPSQTSTLPMRLITPITTQSTTQPPWASPAGHGIPGLIHHVQMQLMVGASTLGAMLTLALARPTPRSLLTSQLWTPCMASPCTIRMPLAVLVQMTSLASLMTPPSVRARAMPMKPRVAVLLAALGRATGALGQSCLAADSCGEEVVTGFLRVTDFSRLALATILL